MHFDLSDDQVTIQRTAREFLAARYKLEEVRRLALEDERGFTDKQWQEIVDLGWPGIAVPEENGGQGLGTVELAVIAEELGYALAPSPLQATWGAALIAPDALDLDAGDIGTVVWFDDVAPHGASARVGVTLDGRVGAVTAGERVEGIDPTTPLARVTLEEGGAGAADVTRGVAQLTVALAAESVGIAQRCLELSVEYAKDRKQFDRPIGSYQGVSHRIAQMLLEVEGARALVHEAAWTLDNEPETAARSVSMAKAYASDCGVRVSTSAIQVHGGIGFTWEHDLHFFVKRARANAAVLGDARSHREAVADVVFA